MFRLGLFQFRDRTRPNTNARQPAIRASDLPQSHNRQPASRNNRPRITKNNSFPQYLLSTLQQQSDASRSEALLSPWLERFEVEPITRRENHSGLAPEFPRVNDPLYYDVLPTPGSFAAPKNFSEADSVFYLEEQQMRYHYGLKTWQAGALNHYVRFSPQLEYMSGGHRPTDQGNAADDMFDKVWDQHIIRVSEEDWFPFFRRDRWYDWIDDTEDASSKERGMTWSVDNPKYWHVLRVSIELADRMLKALLRDGNDFGA
ncbi:hypothetical protein GGR57DRAFT_518230, partial [Xylariaceae sp. FL1272]